MTNKKLLTLALSLSLMGFTPVAFSQVTEEGRGDALQSFERSFNTDNSVVDQSVLDQSQRTRSDFADSFNTTATDDDITTVETNTTTDNSLRNADSFNTTATDDDITTVETNTTTTTDNSVRNRADFADSFNTTATDDDITTVETNTTTTTDNSVRNTDSFNTALSEDNDIDQSVNDSFNVRQDGYVNLNGDGSTASIGNMAGNDSLIFDGDVVGLGLLDGGSGAGGAINTGWMQDSVNGYESAIFRNVGVGVNGDLNSDASLNNSQTTVLMQTP